MGGTLAGRWGVGTLLFQPPLDEPDDRLDGEDLADVPDLRVRLELREIRVREAGLQGGDPLGRHPPVLHELGILLDVLGEEFPLRDLEAERLLEPEDDVKEVDRLGPEVARQRRVGRDLIVIHREGLHQNALHLREDLVSCHAGGTLLARGPPGAAK